MSVPSVRYFVGVDLGQVSDFTALAVLERPVVSTEDVWRRRRPSYALRHLRRLPLGTPYPDVVRSVVSLLSAAFLSGCTLAVDQTGVDRAVVDMLADTLRGQVSCMFFPITITAGHALTTDDSGGLHVPKKDLVGTLQLLLQTRRVRHYAVRHLERLPPATPYAKVFARLAEVFADPPLYGSKLVVDYTGVGWPVLAMLRKAKVWAKIIPLFVTSGNRHSLDERGSWCVPRQELAATVQVLLQSRRLQVAPTLPQTATLVRELTAFQLKTTAATKQELDAWRQGRHDDWVLAVAVAAWLGENAMRRLVIFA